MSYKRSVATMLNSVQKATYKKSQNRISWLFLFRKHAFNYLYDSVVRDSAFDKSDGCKTEKVEPALNGLIKVKA
jgi:hypothetical protein